MNKETIKQQIDSCIRKKLRDAEGILKPLVEDVSGYVLQSYDHSREVLQYFIGQLSRIHQIAVPILMADVLNCVNLLSGKFEPYRSGWNEYVSVDWQEGDIKTVLDKITPFLNGKINMSSPNLTLAKCLSDEERHKMVSFIVDSYQRYGANTQWDKDTLENHQLYLWILYSICKVDNQLGWLFYYAGNFVDRIVSSQYAQQARDEAENMILIGHQEGMEAEGYFVAARAYTIANQPLAGLLYLYIALRKWLEQGTTIPYKRSFEILWQVVKIARGIGFCSEKQILDIKRIFDSLNPYPYDIMSFYHTYFSLMFFGKGEKILDDIADFLDSHREIFFKNIEHSAMPWITFVATVKMNFLNADISRLDYYLKAAKSVADYEGNALVFDLIEHQNEEVRLKELILKLGDTRNMEDYSHDNQMAMLFAKLVLDKSYMEKTPSSFLLGMHVRADFTFVRSTTLLNGVYGRVVFRNVDGKDYFLPIEDWHFLEVFMQQGENNEVLWIGQGARGLYGMSLFAKTFSFDNLTSLGRQDVSNIQKDIISGLKYERDVKNPGQPVYIKDVNEMEREANELKDKLIGNSISIIDGAERLLFVKDMDIAAYPHQLLVDSNKNEFVGCVLPSCNIISTEVLIKTNFEQPLNDDFSCAYWSPINSQEFTFAMIKGQLEQTLNDYNFTCNDDANSLCPINSEINIACAHGGVDISDTSWFYADDKPIVEIDKIIGKGKLLILFVCHSGTISRSDYDNAMHTLIKRYIRKGYSSVIAPMWSLNTEILPTWLETFMAEIKKGDFVIDALYKANMAVKDKYISPEVYACLHLFGNPFLQIGEQPVLSVIEDNNDN